MKIGVFDSGVGGLLITKSLVDALPEYDYLYLGDTARLPYGNRSQETVLRFTLQAVEYLFSHDCALVIIACNTASAEALGQVQEKFVNVSHPNRRVLGVLIPSAEAAVASGGNNIGLIATSSTVSSRAYEREILRLNPSANITSVPAPLLVPLVENDGTKWTGPILDHYLKNLTQVDTLILGCTHYPYLKADIRSKLAKRTQVISQDEIVPPKLAKYLERHPDLEKSLSKTATQSYRVTELTSDMTRLAETLFGRSINIENVGNLDK